MGRERWGTNKTQFVLERVTIGLCIIPALIWALAPAISFSFWYIRIAYIAFGILIILYLYMIGYRAYIKKNWYKCRGKIFPFIGAQMSVFIWLLLPFPPDISIKQTWVPFLLLVLYIFSSIVDYRVYFGILNEDNPELTDDEPKE